MLEAMRLLAVSRLWQDLGGDQSADLETWYRHLREHQFGRLFPYLVEDVGEEASGQDKPRYYTLSADRQDGAVAVLEVHELKPGDREKLPFNQASGSQSAALGPLIKRTPPSQTKPAGPSRKIQKTTLASFAKIAQGRNSWSPYFRAAHNCWTRPKLRVGSKVTGTTKGALHAALEIIEEKRTVLLAFRTAAGHLPGEVPEYVAYLKEILATTKYATRAVPATPDQTCALCGNHPVVVYPNAVKGAGINLANLDRAGAFPGLDAKAAWKYYALCVGCADLLYVYWFHCAAPFLTTVAGERALVIPSLNGVVADHQKFLDRLKQEHAGTKPTSGGQEGIIHSEEQLLRLLSEERAVLTLTLLWADFGQRIDGVRGVVSEVLPSRLRQLAECHGKFTKVSSPFFPTIPLDEFPYDLALKILGPLFRRPGGKKVQKQNDSRRLFDLRRDLAEAIYQQEPFPQEQFWAEIHKTAQGHWDEAVAAAPTVYRVLHEGHAEKKKANFLTLAGWVRQLARFLYYLRAIGVAMPDPEPIYQPRCPVLRPYFGPESAIHGPAKAFAFILGALYGKLLQVQAARRVNFGTNALTWLKRLTLRGADLPDLYNKVRNKLLEYERDGKFHRGPVVRAVEAELTELQKHLGNHLPKLNEIDTCFFLLLGQAVATQIMPSKKKPGVSQ